MVRHIATYKQEKFKPATHCFPAF